MLFAVKGIETFAIWVVLNVAGFWIGWNLGGNDFSSSGLHAAARNAFYGGAFGGAQMLALWIILRPKHLRLLLWPFATSVSFAVGVRVWKQWHVPGLASIDESYRLGAVLCVLVGVAQTIALAVVFPHLRRRWLGLWLSADAVSWVVLEHLSATRGWEGRHILVAVAPASAVTGLALVVISGWYREEHSDRRRER